jgi:hypothetical protein
LAAPELLPRNHLLLGVDPVNLKYERIRSCSDSARA